MVYEITKNLAKSLSKVNEIGKHCQIENLLNYKISQKNTSCICVLYTCSPCSQYLYLW